MSNVQAFSEKFLYGEEEEKVFQMVSKIWDKNFPKKSQLHGNCLGIQTFSQEVKHFALKPTYQQ